MVVEAQTVVGELVVVPSLQLNALKNMNTITLELCQVQFLQTSGIVFIRK